MCDPRRAGIEVQIIIEIEGTDLRRIRFVQDIAGTNRAIASTRTGRRFENRAAITELRHFMRRSHAGDAGSKDDHGFANADIGRPVARAWRLRAWW